MGDVVQITDNNSIQERWIVGRVVEVFPGADGLVRVAKVKTDSGEFLRPIHRLALLEPGSTAGPAVSGENVQASDEKLKI